jgi:superfamily II DNA or RNA helicase
MQKSQRPLLDRQRVLVRDEPWVVSGIETFPAVQIIHLHGIGVHNHSATRAVMRPFDVVQPLAASTRLRAVSRRRTLVAAAQAIADAKAWSDCWTAAAADIDLRSWQLEPAIAAVCGATRILLADGVGLGKTIQAITILSELCARGLASRALVLTPPSLREQWADEMRQRFHLAPAVFDQEGIRASVASLPVGVNPWHVAPVVVSSIDLVKRPDVHRAIRHVPYDLLIVDEAHHVTRQSDRGALVAELAARTPWVVLVTATPHSGEDAAFDYLQALGADPTQPMRVFRRTAPRSLLRARRRSRLLAVRPTAAERALLDQTLAYARAVRRCGRGRRGAGLVAAVIARLAASSAAAAARTIARRHQLLAGGAPVETQPPLPWEDDDGADADLDEVLLAQPGLASAEAELSWLARLSEAAHRASPQSSKVRALRRLLRRTNESLVVFSEYRVVAERIAESIADLASVGVLHGGRSAVERAALVRAFTTGALRVLVATDAAGEGLNLHHRCRVVLNMELPWMPRRLEQRIGRVDRLGQSRRVHAIHLVHRDSYEAHVLARLERRRRAVEARTQQVDAAEDVVRAGIERRLRGSARVTPLLPLAGVFAPSPEGRRHRQLVVLFRASIVDDAHRLVQQVAAGVAIAFDRRIVLTRRTLRTLLAHPEVTESIRQQIEDCRSAACSTMQPVAAALAARLSTCLSNLNGTTMGQWQPALFDTGAYRAHEQERGALLELREYLLREHTRTVALDSLHVAPPEFVGAWWANDPGRRP